MDVTSFLILLIIAFAVATMYYIMIYVPEQHRKDITKKIGDLAKQFRLMDRLRDETNIQRVLILKSHNGDGVPKPGYKVKVTALYESYEPPFRNVVNDYQGLEVDGDYILMLEDVKMYGYTAMFTHEMKDSLLRRIYEREGVAWSYVFFIGQDRESWYYGSLATSDQQSPFQRGYGLAVELFINNIRSMYHQINNTTLRKLRKRLYL